MEIDKIFTAGAKLFLLWTLLLLTHTKSVNGRINLYINRSHVKELIGIDGDLYYIRDDVENKNAIAFPIHVPVTVDHVRYLWQNKLSPVKEKVEYSVTVSSLDSDILKSPKLSIPTRGKLPTLDEGEFNVTLRCRKFDNSNGRVHLVLNISSVRGVSSLNFSLIKLCNSFNDAEPWKRPNLIRKLTKPVKYDDNKEDDKKEFYIAVGVGSSIFLFLATVIAFLHINSMPKPKDDSKPTVVEATDAQVPPVPHQLPANLTNVIRAERQRKEVMTILNDIKIQPHLLTLGNTVQEGSFGRAYMGTLTMPDTGEEIRVLAKSVIELASQEQVTLFLLESSLLKRTNHHNVLPLMHVCLDGTTTPITIYPYMNRGNLKNYLRLTRTSEPLSKPLTTRDIVLMAVQVANGLQYMSRRRIVHKDVATRNCVVDEDLHVKVCDNALSRDFFPGDYHCLGDNDNRPVRWMAAESIEFNKFLSASDVWSYGVLLWELTSLAQTPYANVDPFEMLQYLQSGFRLPQPAQCPDDLFTVMACCWALSPEERPQFPQILGHLEAFFETLNAFI